MHCRRTAADSMRLSVSESCENPSSDMRRLRSDGLRVRFVLGLLGKLFPSAIRSLCTRTLEDIGTCNGDIVLRRLCESRPTPKLWFKVAMVKERDYNWLFIEAESWYYLEIYGVKEN